MKIVVLDRNIAVVDYFSFLLKNFSMEFRSFTEEKECVEYLNNNQDIDFIFIEEFFYKNFLEKSLNSFLIVLSFAIKDLDIENRIYYRMKKDILPIEFNGRFSIIKKLREYFLKEEAEKSELTGVISYKEKQEEMAIQKQLKLFSNQLVMFYENDFLIETFFKSKEILSGDGVLTKRIDENRYFLAVIDAMGKGLSASLTSANSVGFLSYVLKESLKNNTFNFQTIVENFTNYIKSILIENETLCFVIGYVEDNKFTFTNFGMPPIYVDREKIRPNNMPLSEWSEKINIDKVKFKDDLLMFSDGLIECWTKEDELFLRRFQRLLPKFTFLSDIMRDFKRNAIQSDDTTVIYVKKDNFQFNKIYEKEVEISLPNIEKVVKGFDIKIAGREKIEFMLNELLMNSYEHSSLNLQNLKNAVLQDIKIELKDKNNIKAKIVIYENDKFIKIEYSDNGDGFDIDILKTLGKNKFHGRGIKMMKYMANAYFYNYKGNSVKFFISKDT